MTDKSDKTPEASDKETILIGLVRKALSQLEQGTNPDIQNLCLGHEDLIEPLSEALGFDNDLGSLQRAVHDTDPLAGILLAQRYRLDECIGKGAMGVVYTATDTELDREVAIKLFDAQHAKSATDEQRFRREAELLARLDHRHVCSVHDRGRDEKGLLFLVMDRFRGASLAGILARSNEEQDLAEGERDPAWLADLLGDAAAPEPNFMRTTVRWIAEIASGLCAAHARGVFHRDVKPSNIFIRRNYDAVLLDFGIATNADGSDLTATLTALGTPWYMAPEQAVGTERQTAAIDIYGVCATLYHMLTLQPPYEGDAAQVLSQLQHQDPTPASHLVPNLPRDLQAILDCGMARDPRHRYKTMAALENDLRAFLLHQPLSVRPLSGIGRFWRRTRRAPSKAIAISASIATVLLVTVVVPIWRADQVRAATVQRTDFERRLPCFLAVEGQPAQRLLVDLGERQESINSLSKLLALAPDDFAARLWRAALRLDQGDHQGAALDFDSLVEHADTPYLREAAARYRRANRELRGVLSIDLTSLPRCETAEDHFVAGFHELRYRSDGQFAARADAHLEQAVDYVPARDLRLIALVARGDAEQKLAFFRTAYDESIALSQVYGHDTARTLAIRGLCLLVMRRYDESIDALEQSLKLRPERHGPLQNLAIAYRRRGDTERALEYLKRASSIRPSFINTALTVAQVQRDLGQYEAAIHTVRSFTGTIPEERLWKRDDVLANIHLNYAIRLLDRGESDKSMTQIKAAVTTFAAARDHAPEARKARESASLAYAEAIASGDFKSALPQLFRIVTKTPQNPYALINLVTLLPDDLDREETLMATTLLRSLAIKLAPGDLDLQQEQTESISRDQREFDKARDH